MSNILGNAATLGFNVSSSGSYTLISPLSDISTPKPEQTVVNVSSLTDTTDIKLAGFLDNKSFTWTMHYSTTNFALIATLLGVSAYYQITFNDTHTCSFQAIMKSYEAEYKRNELVAFKCEAEVSGVVTWA
jgi:hypothetical protein